VSRGAKEISGEVSISYLNSGFWNELMGTAMPTKEQEPEYPKELTYECPDCGTSHTFTDDGRAILIKCFQCGRVLLSRTEHATVSTTGVKVPVKTTVWDDISTSGRPVYISKDESDRARKLLEW
jgi:ribosomal protein S27E